MTLSRMVRIQLMALTAAGLVGAVVLGVVFLRVPSYLGIDEMTIKARFAESAGLYERAEVTYRGDPVGSVSALHFIEGGVEAHLDIDDDEDIPVDTTARVHSLSAIGQQYVDLVPNSPGAPYLEDGDVIPMTRTTTPVSIGTLLDRLAALLEDVPSNDLNVVIDESFQTFRDLGPDLQRLIDEGRLLVEEANRNIVPTEILLQDLRPLLDTQIATSPQIRSLVADLATVTEQLRESDPDIRGLLQQGQPFAAQVSGLFTDLKPTLPVLLANLVSTGEVLRTYNPNLQALAVTYPLLVGAAQGILAPLDEQDQANLDLVLQLNDPPPCIEGFIPPGQRRDPSNLTVAPTPLVYCTLPQDDASVVRGARNLPCQEGPPGRRAATPAQCRGDGYQPAAPDNSPFPPESALERLLLPGH